MNLQILYMYTPRNFWISLHWSKGINNTFRFNSKYSLLKLLCTLVRLYEVTPLQPPRIDFFEIDFPSHPCSQLPFLTFRG